MYSENEIVSLHSVQKALRDAGFYVNYNRLLRIVNFAERLGLVTYRSLLFGTEFAEHKSKKKIKVKGKLPNKLLLPTEKGEKLFDKFHMAGKEFESIFLGSVYDSVYYVWFRMRPRNR